MGYVHFTATEQIALRNYQESDPKIKTDPDLDPDPGSKREKMIFFEFFHVLDDSMKNSKIRIFFCFKSFKK